MCISTCTVKLDRTGLATVPTGSGKTAYSIKLKHKRINMAEKEKLIETKIVVTKLKKIKNKF